MADPSFDRPGRTVSAVLSPPLDRRAHDRVARQLPPTDGRYERLLAIYGGFFHRPCALLVLRQVLK